MSKEIYIVTYNMKKDYCKRMVAFENRMDHYLFVDELRRDKDLEPDSIITATPLFYEKRERPITLDVFKEDYLGRILWTIKDKFSCFGGITEKQYYNSLDDK